MGQLIVVTGGARSGKSRWAEKKAIEVGKKVIYIATAIAFDEGMKDRIEKHRKSRPQHWVTIERYKDFEALEVNTDFLQGDTILIDCMTLMVSNLMLDSGLDFDRCTMKEVDLLEENIFNEVETLIDLLKNNNKRGIIVTNEVGMGLVPSYRMGSIFRDIAGRINQYLGSRADEVYFMVSGLNMKVK